MKKIAVLVLVLFTATLTCASKLCVIGASCKQYELPGIYSLDKDCPHFLKLAPEKRYGHGWCNFSEKNAVICCIGASPVSTVSWKRPQVILNRFGEDCQYFGPNTYTIAVERIFGGMESSPGEFPHFAALGYDRKESELRFDCGGTLITDQHVLTAAHCVVSGRNRPSVVRLGSTTLKESPNDGHIDIAVGNITIHPAYVSRKKYHDIAVIELKHPVTFGPFIWPACLTANGTLQNGRNLTIAGYGRTDFKNASAKSDHLLHATVRETPLEECRDILIKSYKNATISSFDKGVTDDIICARDVHNSADTCQGDSGGPLKAKIGGKFYLFGVTSFGISCGSSFPAFYTKVSSYYQWIESVVNVAALANPSLDVVKVWN